jgi:glycosyltransferase involved in cell wall biosynthesis
MARAVRPALGRLIDEGYDFDAIDAHYFYPDGVAAVMLGKYFNKPVVVTARGTDINLLPRYRIPRKFILWAAEHASGIITVCNYLKQELVGLGVRPGRITPLRNGVDLQRFAPVDREAARAALGISGFTLLSVGQLAMHKGHDLTIKALTMLPGVSLVIAGQGPDRARFLALAAELGVADRLRFAGPVPQAELRTYYNAADAMVLASEREGWANVLLESMACGTPVVATSICGTPEVVAAPEAGRLMPQRTPESLADAVKLLRAQAPDRAATRRYAERFSWDDTTQGQLDLFHNILMGKS